MEDRGVGNDQGCLIQDGRREEKDWQKNKIKTFQTFYKKLSQNGHFYFIIMYS
jgi:hypothetical protein